MLTAQVTGGGINHAKKMVDPEGKGEVDVPKPEMSKKVRKALFQSDSDDQLVMAAAGADAGLLVVNEVEGNIKADDTVMGERDDGVFLQEQVENTGDARNILRETTLEEGEVTEENDLTTVPDENGEKESLLSSEADLLGL